MRTSASSLLFLASLSLSVNAWAAPRTGLPTSFKPMSGPRALVKTFTAPVVLVGYKFGFNYKVNPYTAEVEAIDEPAGNGHVLRSSRPSSLAVDAHPERLDGPFVARPLNRAAAREGYRYLRQEHRVDVILDLRDEADVDAARDDAEAAGLTYRSVRLKDNAWHYPMEESLEAVNILLEETARGRTVDIHCQAGRGRTGMIVAMYQVARHPEWSESDAINYARTHGIVLFGQENVIRRFVRGVANGTIVKQADGRYAKRAA